MSLKGIDVFGTGDCLFPPRTQELREQLVEHADGLYRLPGSDRDFLLQTEIILSTALCGHRTRAVAHHVVLFPSFTAVEAMARLMDTWGMKNTIGRPFVTCRDQAELEDRLFAIAGIHPEIEIFPAHVMTPEGVYGSKNNLAELSEFYGAFLPKIRLCETGLSADPPMLERIPDLAALTFVSSSDVHSAALNRIGREFTVVEAATRDYSAILSALREDDVVFTGEFNPAEGRYFQTGHRADREGHAEAVRYSGVAPERCPVCGKPMLPGVESRCRLLSRDSVTPKPRRYKHLIPLVEVIAHSLGVRSVESPKVRAITLRILERFGSEVALWESESTRVQELLDKDTPPQTLRQIIAVQQGRFLFSPPGSDGCYGVLVIDDSVERS
jgi:PHP family Zn ribbon phosphoesterase